AQPNLRDPARPHGLPRGLFRQALDRGRPGHELRRNRRIDVDLSGDREGVDRAARRPHCGDEAPQERHRALGDHRSLPGGVLARTVPRRSDRRADLASSLRRRTNVISTTCSDRRSCMRRLQSPVRGWTAAKRACKIQEKWEEIMSMAAPVRSIVRDAPVTWELAERASAIRYEDLPDDIRTLTRQCLLDWLPVTLAGSREELSRILAEQAIEDCGKPAASLIGRSEKVSAQQAALVNGAASHALDYDDVNMAMNGHPTVPIVAALLALAEDSDRSGADFIAAFVAGYETECRIGALVLPDHYGRGFHATGTIGSFGAATACAHLLGLDAEKTATALGIAATQAAGLKSMFGTMCKPLHAGKAAQNGLLAALLAACGFTSRTDALECAQGFAATQSSDFRP